MHPKRLLIVTFVLLFHFFSQAQTPVGGFKYGRYGCTVSKYNGVSYEYIPKGFISLDKSGTYTYQGFAKPSKGTFKIDGTGNIQFSGGYLNKGKAEKINRPDKYFLTFPTIPDNRWSMGYIGK